LVLFLKLKKHMYLKIGKIANYLSALIVLGMGVVYLFKNSFMPYHSEAVSMDWASVDGGIQILIIALMRAVSGGYIVSAIVMAFLQNKYSSSKIKWIPLLILITGLVVSLISIYATLVVRFNSPGRPPTFLAIVGIGLLIIGYIFNKKGSSD